MDFIECQDNFPEGEAEVKRINELLFIDNSFMKLIALDYLTDYDGEIPGAGGIIEVGKNDIQL